VSAKAENCLIQDEHEMALVTQARASNHRRHDHDDDRRTRDEHRRTQGISCFERCVDVQGKLTGRDLCLNREYLAYLQLLLSPPIGERTDPILHAEDDREFE